MSQITTHVLDTSRGCPAENISLNLCYLKNDKWETIANGKTNADGRVEALLPDTSILKAGTYRMQFATADYFTEQQLSVFYPWVDVVFNLGSSGEHYHIPLLLSPYGYSTYRGS